MDHFLAYSMDRNRASYLPTCRTDFDITHHMGLLYVASSCSYSWRWSPRPYPSEINAIRSITIMSSVMATVPIIIYGDSVSLLVTELMVLV